MKSILITSSILILLLAALRPLLRGRIDPRLQYALWLIIALRLLAPVELAPSAYSALALLDRAEEPAHIAQAIGRTHVPIPVQSYDEARAQVIQEYRQQGTAEAAFTPGDLAAIDAQARERSQGATLSQLFERYARPVWVGGAALAGLWFLLVNLRLRRRLGAAELLTMSSGLPVFVSDVLPSPCLCGTLRPAIYITPHAVQDPDRLRHVLAHESAHYRHRDHWWALVRCLCLCLYWFDPLVWWAAALSRQDCELACDAGAIRRLGESERLPYGRTLVDMIAAGRCSLMQTATTMAGGKRRVRQRVRLIARKPKTVIAVVLALVLVLGAAVGCTFTGAPDKGATPMGLSANSLQARLLDVPEDLQADAAALRGGESTAITSFAPSALVQYWMNRPYTDYQEGWGWLLTVYQWDQTQFEENYSDVPGTWHCFAKDDNFYYVTARATDVRVPSSEEMVAGIPGATEVETKYLETFEAVKAFAEKAVLETEGVEPYSPDENRQPLDTLQQRLMDLPEEWRDKLSASDDIQEPGCLAYYWLDDPKWQDLSSGWLLTLYRMDGDLVQHNLDQQLWPSTGIDIFARSGGQYYALIWPGDGRYQDGGDLSDEYWTALNAMKDHVKATVLATEGVESFDPFTTPPHFFSNVPQAPLEPGSYAIDGMDYTLVTSYDQVPEDPEQWYLVGQLPGYPVWMFTRNHCEETMFQVEDQLTQSFPYQARYFGGGQIHDGRAPQLMPLDGFGWGPKGTFGPFAVITHVFQGGTDQLYELTVYDLGTDAVTPYVHNWRALMEDFNKNCAVTLDEDKHTATISYAGQSALVDFKNEKWYTDEVDWPAIQQNGFSVSVYEYNMDYVFNSDGTATLRMPCEQQYVACWTLRFTGDGFETDSFRFVQTDDVYTYLSTGH